MRESNLSGHTLSWTTFDISWLLSAKKINCLELGILIEGRKARNAERCEFNLNGDNTLMALTTSAASDSLFNFIPFPSNESSGLLEAALSALSVAAFWPEIKPKSLTVYRPIFNCQKVKNSILILCLWTDTNLENLLKKIYIWAMILDCNKKQTVGSIHLTSFQCFRIFQFLEKCFSNFPNFWVFEFHYYYIT